MVIFIGAEFEGSQRAELGELTFRWYLLTFVAVYWNSHKIICNALHFISSGEYWWFALNAHCLRCFLCVWCNSIFSRFTWSDSLFDLAHVLIFCRSFSTFLFSLFLFLFSVSFSTFFFQFPSLFLLPPPPLCFYCFEISSNFIVYFFSLYRIYVNRFLRAMTDYALDMCLFTLYTRDECDCFALFLLCIFIEIEATKSARHS